MDLKELREKIFELEGDKSVIEFKDFLSSSDYSDIDYYEAELAKLYTELNKQPYYYVEEKLIDNNHISYLDVHLWHASLPHAFVSEEEAQEAIEKENTKEIERYGNPLYTRVIKQHLPNA